MPTHITYKTQVFKMPNICVTCGKMYNKGMNLTNWKRHVDACKKRKMPLNSNNRLLEDFFNKKQRPNQIISKYSFYFLIINY